MGSEQAFLIERTQPQLDRDEYDAEALTQELGVSQWDLGKRILTREQLRDLAFVRTLRNGAVFSVPGAGKTSVALALHCVLRNEDPTLRLLVVAPKNAFPAWDEALVDCLYAPPAGGFTRLTGGQAAIAQLLGLEPSFAIVSYDQGRIASELIKTFLNRNHVHLILDESHRIKSGEGKNSQTFLDLAPFASRRDILSGTPMPNSSNDLVPQFMFLYPASNLGRRILDIPNPGFVVRPLYARTRYSELGVPRPIPDYRAVEMSNVQRALYALLRNDFLKQLHLSARDSVQLKNSVMRLLRVAIDPADAAQSILSSDDLRPGTLSDICEEVTEDGLCPRLELTIELARDKVESGQKVVLWVPFIGTINKLVTELAEFGPRALYGQTPSGQVDDEGTRENILRRFHDSNEVNVLVANPAAGGEGISLHRVCHSAIYVGRTYNAAHYMQSRDRICRLGMPEGVVPEITVIEARAPERLGSIDLSVRRRLDTKIDQMGRVLDDPDLVAIALESDEFDQNLLDGLNLDDLNDLISELRGEFG